MQRGGVFILVFLLILLSPAQSTGIDYLDEAEDSQVIRYGLPYDFPEFSYYAADSYATAQWIKAISAGLYSRSSDGTWLPELAAALPSISADKKTWTVSLKSDLVFPHGQPLKAEDVVFSYQVALTPAINSNSYGYMSEYFDANSSITELDESTIEFNFNQPYVFGYNFLTLPITSKAFFGEDYQRCVDGHMDHCSWNAGNGYFAYGAGPFVLDEISFAGGHGNQVTVTKNPNYWDADNVWPSKLEFVKIPSTAEAIAQLGAHSIQLMDSQYVAQIDAFDSLTGVADTFTDDPAFLEHSLNHRHPYFGTGEAVPDPEIDIDDSSQARLVRKAMSHLINRTDYIEVVLEGLGRAASSPMPAASFGWDEEVPVDQYDLDRAKKLMETAGFDFNLLGTLFGNGSYENSFFDIYMMSPATGPARPSWIPRFLENLPKIGIGVADHVVTGWDTIIPRTFGYHDGLPPIWEEGGFDILSLGYSFALDWDPSDLYTTAGLCGTGTCNNFYSYQNSTVENLIDDYLTEFDPDQRMQIASELQHLLAQDLPVLPLFHPLSHWGYHDDLIGVDFQLLSVSEGNYRDFRMAGWTEPATVGTPPAWREHPLATDSDPLDNFIVPLTSPLPALMVIAILYRKRWRTRSAI